MWNMNSIEHKKNTTLPIASHDRTKVNILDIEGVIRFLWPKYPARDLACALGVPQWKARHWLYGHDKMPIDKAMELLRIFNSVFSMGRAVIEEYAARRVKAEAELSRVRTANILQGNKISSGGASIVDL